MDNKQLQFSKIKQKSAQYCIQESNCFIKRTINPQGGNQVNLNLKKFRPYTATIINRISQLNSIFYQHLHPNKVVPRSLVTLGRQEGFYPQHRNISMKTILTQRQKLKVNNQQNQFISRKQKEKQSQGTYGLLRHLFLEQPHFNLYHHSVPPLPSYPSHLKSIASCSIYKSSMNSPQKIKQIRGLRQLSSEEIIQKNNENDQFLSSNSFPIRKCSSIKYFKNKQHILQIKKNTKDQGVLKGIYIKKMINQEHLYEHIRKERNKKKKYPTLKPKYNPLNIQLLPNALKGNKMIIKHF